ncbi:major facilitator superfamily domain-containing protein [Zopfochytrium polystomum]|nr:major facilitator superfamily domain-containing protein [Zopfochytrium polystomum]
MIFIGTLILCSGLLLASFATRVWHLFLTQGFLFGLGSSIAYFPAVAIPSQFFSSKRGLATGIAVSGSGVGGLVLTLVTTKMLDALGFQWTMRISAAFALVSLLAVNPLLETRIPPAPNSKTDLTIFKDSRFVLLICTAFFATFANLVPIYFLPLFAQERLGLARATGSAVLSVYNGSSALGRVLLGLGADSVLGRINSLVLCMFLSAASFLGLWSFANSLALLMVFAVVNGFVAGGFISLFPVTLASIFGVRRLPSLVGTIFSVSSIGNFVGSPLAGVIKDASGGFDAAIYYAGGVTLVSFLFVLSVRLMEDRNPFKRM